MDEEAEVYRLQQEIAQLEGELAPEAKSRKPAVKRKRPPSPVTAIPTGKQALKAEIARLQKEIAAEAGPDPEELKLQREYHKLQAQLLEAKLKKQKQATQVESKPRTPRKAAAIEQPAVTLYCICQKPWSDADGDEMVQCEGCENWCIHFVPCGITTTITVAITIPTIITTAQHTGIT